MVIIVLDAFGCIEGRARPWDTRIILARFGLRKSSWNSTSLTGKASNRVIEKPLLRRQHGVDKEAVAHFRRAPIQVVDIVIHCDCRSFRDSNSRRLSTDSNLDMNWCRNNRQC